MRSLYRRQGPLVIDAFDSRLFGVRPCCRGARSVQAMFPSGLRGGDPSPALFRRRADEFLQALLDVEQLAQSLVIRGIDSGVHAR